jgi:hypothetical protein
MLTISIYVLLSAIIGYAIFRRQNRLIDGKARLGGEISASKALWLYWTISVWFMFMPYVLLSQRWQDAFHYGWMALTISMWLRGIAEIYMLFISKNWTPYIGIAHDVFTFAIMAVAYLWFHESFAVGAWWVQYFSIVLLISLVVEIYYAKTFLKIVGQRTKGEEGVWYAHKNDPVFLHLLRVTTVCNWFFYLSTIIFIYFYIVTKLFLMV